MFHARFTSSHQPVTRQLTWRARRISLGALALGAASLAPVAPGCSAPDPSGAPHVTTAALALVTPAKPGDFNGDGNADVFCNDFSGGAAVSLTNGAGSGFAAPSSWASSWCGRTGILVGSGDFDGDGYADLFCREPGSPA